MTIQLWGNHTEVGRLAMNDDRAVLRVRVVVHDVAHPAPELQEGVGERVGVAGPLRVVEQDHLSLLVVLTSEKGQFNRVLKYCMPLFRSSPTFLSLMVLIMKFASCSSLSTETPTPLYTSSRPRPAGQYCTHIT